MTGKVYLVGAGPGDIGLITTYGKELVETADCIVYDRLIGTDLLSLAKSDCEKIYVGKESHNHTLSQEKIEKLLVNKSKKYNLIVRLKGGDPYVFGRGGEEALFLKKHNIPFEVVPGISSSVSALTYAGIPITHRGISKGFRVITAHSKSDNLSDIDYPSLLNNDETYVFMMGLKHLGEISDSLISAGKNPKTPVAVISNGTLPTQKKCVGTLDTIVKQTSKSSIVSPAIIVVGNVVALQDNLSFFENKPLFGKKIFVPYIQSKIFSLENELSIKNNELIDKLKRLGANVVSLQVGIINYIDFEISILDNLSSDDYLTFTSKNGVNSFFWNLHKNHLDLRILNNCKIAVVGKSTAKALSKFGLYPDVVSQKENGKDLGATLKKLLNENNRIIHFSAKDYSSDFQNEININIEYINIPCYENTLNKPDIDKNLLEDIFSSETVVFTSGSNAIRTLKLTNGKLPDKVISIGPHCSKILELNNVFNYTQATHPDIDSVLNMLINNVS